MVMADCWSAASYLITKWHHVLQFPKPLANKLKIIRNQRNALYHSLKTPGLRTKQNPGLYSLLQLFSYFIFVLSVPMILSQKVKYKP